MADTGDIVRAVVQPVAVDMVTDLGDAGFAVFAHAG
jgi:hypothetical protein